MEARLRSGAVGNEPRSANPFDSHPRRQLRLSHQLAALAQYAGRFAIPNSMYLTSKPAFFGSNPWPWVDPTTGTTYTLPAKARYDAGCTSCPRPHAGASHDFNGDGKSDIVWRDTNGNVAIWVMSGTSPLESVELVCREFPPNGRSSGLATSTAMAMPTFSGATAAAISRCG